jgi:hypothetical protein
MTSAPELLSSDGYQSGADSEAVFLVVWDCISSLPCNASLLREAFIKAGV